MLALLLIPILVSGYILVIANPYHYYRLHTHDGQLLYLKVASLGTLSLIASVAIAVLIKFTIPQFHLVDLLVKNFSITGEPKNDRVYAWLILLSFSSILISLCYVLIVWVKNLIRGWEYQRKHKNVYGKVRQAKNARVLKKTIPTGTMDSMLLEALESNPKRSILINLSSRKVYVGIINGLSDPNEKEGPNKYISFFPLMSGYRDKDTLLVDFTNVYPTERVVKLAPTVKGTKTISTTDLDIIVSSDEISHISWFDFEIFNSTNNSVKSKGEKNNNSRKVNKKFI
ncbi:hypothetical protein [Providencia alcalifaciens]|uniref:Uncharacterized protein n=1 Tax=Providencia alcalifaciens 205/92 TaxID=1256988 RepID=A0AAV3M0D6_9GAMM|nr:hypothetical protein [Providencia alcalifaciens]EUD09162.1 hypothetical protein HMPREF1563_3294 [Providencia alcalifaciens 205/92]MTC29110.1 hypothetical protein [Providencia alcalifaciens]MTC64199.1 hypothetical protein [Providencia alcalifaciens]WGZ54046.1 hypothetical protein PO864_17710 [Providencia alcalifaciens]